jgi:hypothetical protein
MARAVERLSCFFWAGVGNVRAVADTLPYRLLGRGESMAVTLHYHAVGMFAP